ncbi:MAG TPA: molybdate ABC transporter substrate-binding protein [Desulfobulbus sp.]|nr:molybdate ABC transporter substrate-binding protein [Desulfobulbus sp.]
MIPRIFCILVVLSATTARAAPGLLVAVAANFAPAMEEIGARFTGETGIPVRTTVSSSGRLYAQIMNRAPFALFFSADTRRPELLYQQGYCERPRVYVRGRVVLWSRDRGLCDGTGDWRRLVTGSRDGIGIPNPELAPYGASARQALVDAGLWQQVRDRLVFAANVGQSFQYAAIGATGVSFVSGSLAATGSEGCFLPVPVAQPVAQSACVVRDSADRDAARALLRYLRRNAATAILERYGYEFR